MKASRVWLGAVLCGSSLTSACSGGGGTAQSPIPAISVTDSVPPTGDLQVPFGSVTQGSSLDQTVTVRNSGAGQLVVGSVAGVNPLAAPFSITADTCSGRTVAPSITCTLTVRFAPAGTGSFADTFDIPSNDPASPAVTVSVSGTGTAAPVPHISVVDSVAPPDDLSIPFGNVVVGSTVDQTVTVTNIGSAALLIGTIAGADPLATPFSITADTCSGQTVASSATCTLTVRFAPAGTGSFADTFDIPSNDPASPTVTVSVSGTGIVPHISVADSVAPPDDLSIPFGNVVVGSTVDQTVTVTNIGSAALAIGGVASADPLAAPFSIAADTCSGQTIGPSATCTLTVRFAPAGTGSFAETFDIPSNDPGSPSVVISVAGMGLSVTTSVALPMTGQTVCSDTAGSIISCTGTGQDGDLMRGVAWPSPRFAITYCDTVGPCASQGADCDANAADDVVTDALTGLMWSRSGNLLSGATTWTNALNYAETLTLCGFGDWRLPNRKELESLVNHGVTNIHLWLNGVAFSGVQFGKYWTSTTYVWGTGNTDNAWVVSLGDGSVGINDKTTPPWYLLPVRDAPLAAPAALPGTGQRSCYDASGASISCAGTSAAGQDGALLKGVSWPLPRFTDNADGTVTDDLTGLVWTKNANAPGPGACAPGGAKTWQGALDYVACLNSSRYLGGGWRLPNIDELESLFHSGFNEETCGLAACTSNAAWLSAQGFSGVQIYYWSSTSYAGDTTTAWILRMYEGFVQFDVKSANYYYVWPVRGGNG